MGDPTGCPEYVALHARRAARRREAEELRMRQRVVVCSDPESWVKPKGWTKALRHGEGPSEFSLREVTRVAPAEEGAHQSRSLAEDAANLGLWPESDQKACTGGGHCNCPESDGS